MLRRLFVGIALLAAFASLGSFSRQPEAVQASPANQSLPLFFSDQKDGGEQVEYNSGEGVIWAHLDGVPTGANLSYILRLNGDDYKWGDLDCCKNGGGPVEFPVFNKDGKAKGIPGGAYQLFVYDGDKELARGAFGVKGGKGSDNDNDH